MKQLRSQRGSGILMALAFMALVVPLTTAALSIASTMSMESRTATDLLVDHYSVLGASQDAAYRLAYEDGFSDSLEPGVPLEYIVTLNGRQVTTTVIKLSSVVGDPPPPNFDNSRTHQVSKIVTPSTAQVGVWSQFVYTISVENRGDKSKSLNVIYDDLPPGFSYVSLSTTGITTSEPSVTGSLVTWDISSEGISLAPGQTVYMNFHAEATVGEGTYCNESWVEPGGSKTSSGKTALVTVGTPANNLCAGPAISLSKVVNTALVLGGEATTFTYTITIDNNGSVTLNMSKIRDRLPGGFMYVVGTAGGDITGAEPSTMIQQGSQRLDWNFSPDYQIPPGETRTLTFDAIASVPPGDYFNEVWLTIAEFTDTIYTWPTALIKIMSAAETSAESGGLSAIGEVWANDGSYVTSKWQIYR